jgi:pimeloyl-ACP methyl ester carboxylesterase
MAPVLWLIVIAAACLPVIGWAWRRTAEAREARRPPLGEYVDVGGRRLHVVRRGQDGPAVVIESGAGISSATWWPMQDRLATLTTVVTYDRAGLGCSDPAPLPRTLGDRVDVYAPGLLGNTPVAVLSHGKRFPGPFAVLETNHQEAMQSLAALSGNSVLTVAENSSHGLPLEEPEVVIDAIRAVCQAARTGLPLRDVVKAT